MEIWHVTSHLIAGVLCKASDSDLTLRSPGCYSCSCVCSVPGWVEASGPKREVSSSPAASSASRCPPAASWLAPVACNVQINKLAWSFLWAGHAIFRPMYVPVGMLTWWGSGRHIHLSTAQWRRLRAARWWSGPGAGGPACFCPYKPSSPASTTKTSISGNFRNRIHHHHNGAAKTSPVLRYMQQKWNAFFPSVHAVETHLLDEELFAHRHTLVEPLLVALQHLLLLVYLPPQVTVRLTKIIRYQLHLIFNKKFKLRAVMLINRSAPTTTTMLAQLQDFHI